MQCYRLLLPRRMTIQDFLNRAGETQAADLVGPPHGEPQEVFARWVCAFDIPDSEFRSLALWVQAPHWAFPAGFLCARLCTMARCSCGAKIICQWICIWCQESRTSN